MAAGDEGITEGGAGINLRVAGTDGAGGLDEEADDVDLRQGGAGPLVGALAEQRARLVDPRRVEQHEL